MGEQTEEKSKWDFLTSTRFYALVIGAISLYLKTKGFFGDAEMILVATITAGFITIGTADKVAEKIGGEK